MWQAYKIKFKHWLSRARLLNETSFSTAGIYSYTVPDDKYPYALLIFCCKKKDSVFLRKHIPKFGKVLIRKINLPQAYARYRDLLNKKEIVYLKGTDLLLTKTLNKQALFRWKRVICPVCQDELCLKGSTQLFRCKKIADIIGAIESAEIIDIYHLYKQNKEPVWFCFEKLAEMRNLSAILRIAKPRWPKQFPDQILKNEYPAY